MKERDKLRELNDHVEPYEVWDAMITGLDIELVIYHVDYCINRKRMSLQQVDDYINNRAFIQDAQNFIRLNYTYNDIIEVYYMDGDAKVGFECAVKGLTAERKRIHKIRRENHGKKK